MDAARIRSALAWRTRRYLNRARARLPHRPYPVILMYHRVAEEPFDPWGGAVSPARFRNQVQWIEAHRTLLSLGEFAERHRRGALPRDAIAITLDDGYACVASAATPILQEFAAPATVFVSPEIIEEGTVFWWDRLQAIVLGQAATSIRVAGQRFELGDKRAEDAVWRPGAPPATKRQQAYLDIHTLLSRLSPAALKRSMDELGDDASTGEATKRPMTGEQVRRTASSGVQFGSHALTHAWLPSLSEAEQKLEIVGSIERVRDLTGEVPVTLAYPYGMFDERSKRIAAEAGFSSACTTQNLAVSVRSPLHALPRLAVGNWQAAELERALGSVCLG